MPASFIRGAVAAVSDGRAFVLVGEICRQLASSSKVATAVGVRGCRGAAPRHSKVLIKGRGVCAALAAASGGREGGKEGGRHTFICERSHGAWSRCAGTAGRSTTRSFHNTRVNLAASSDSGNACAKKVLFWSAARGPETLANAEGSRLTQVLKSKCPG